MSKIFLDNFYKITKTHNTMETNTAWKNILPKILGILFIFIGIIGGITELSQSFNSNHNGYKIKEYVITFFLFYYGIALWFYKHQNQFPFLYHVFKTAGYFFIFFSAYGISYELESYLNQKSYNVLSGMAYGIIFLGWGVSLLYFSRKLISSSKKLHNQNDPANYNSIQGVRVHKRTCDGCGASSPVDTIRCIYCGAYF
ncbi:MAG: hypothetical protein H7A23_25810 [Leptospiraceae bacterium]|nr:hypothetical protein [Leptospiraceae bacterium]MCP5497985.1 hypothetical protein [Leptospiraceae bacterium]